MISLAWKKRAIPLYWKILTHKGASNLTEQKAVILPVIRLLKCQKIMMTADREFHSIFLSHWFKKYQKQDVYFVEGFNNIKFSYSLNNYSTQMLDKSKLAITTSQIQNPILF